MWIFDRIDNLYVSRIVYHLVTICEVFCTDIRLLIVLRVLTGLFDALTAISQAYWSVFLLTFSCVGDVTTFSQRANYLADLEAVNNVAQSLGPLVGAALANYNLRYAVYAFSPRLTIGLLPPSSTFSRPSAPSFYCLKVSPTSLSEERC